MVAASVEHYGALATTVLLQDAYDFEEAWKGVKSSRWKTYLGELEISQPAFTSGAECVARFVKYAICGFENTVGVAATVMQNMQANAACERLCSFPKDG